MPMLAYRCEECGDVFEELVRVDDADSIACGVCGGKVERHYQGKALFGMIGAKEPSCAGNACGYAGTGCGMACRH